MSDAPATPPPLNERVAGLLNDLIGDATRASQGHLADRLRAEASRWRSTETSVVVAAEPNRGKSSLLNAMLGRDVLPSGTNVTTTTFVVIRHGAEPKATVHRRDASPAEMAIEDASRWITAPIAEEVDGVVVELPHPMLATGLVLIDTPGVGGVDTVHGRLTLSTLARADALLFLLDSAEPVSRPEIDFLARATERLDRVVFVVTKIDQAPAWRTTADDDRALIARHANRFASAPIVGASARLKRTADDLARAGTPDPTLAVESGMTELGHTVLRSVVGKVAVVRLANLLRLADTTLGELEAPLLAAAAAAQGEPEAKAQAAADQAALDQLRDVSERLQIEVTDRFNALREQANLDLARMLRELGARFDPERVAKTAADMLDQVVVELRTECAELSTSLDEQIDQILGDIVGAVGDLEVELPDVQLGGGVPLDLEPGSIADDGAGGGQMVKLRVASAAASGGTGLAFFARSLGSDPVLAAVMGAGALLAVATAAINVRLMRKQTDVAATRKQVQGAIEGARQQITPALRQQILVAQRAIEAAMRAAVRQRIKELTDRVASATQLARADDAARQRAKADAEQRLGALVPRRHTVATLRAEVEALL